MEECTTKSKQHVLRAVKGEAEIIIVVKNLP